MRDDTPQYDPSIAYKAAGSFYFAGYPKLKGDPIDPTLIGDPFKGEITEVERSRKMQLILNAHLIEPMTEEEAAVLPPLVPELSDDQKARIAQLIKDNDRAALNDLAGDDTHKIVDADKLPTKEAVAEAIVRAETPAA